jgi:hypothetical protein
MNNMLRSGQGLPDIDLLPPGERIDILLGDRLGQPIDLPYPARVWADGGRNMGRSCTVP